MSTPIRVDFAEAALLALLRDNLSAAYAAALGVESAPVQIDSLGETDFDDEGRLVLEPPAVRVRFKVCAYDPARDNRRLTYQSHAHFDILCFESSLRGGADERKQTLVLVAVVQDQLSGARINMADGSSSMPITLGPLALVETEQGPVDQLFSQAIEVEGFAQFSGVNAQLP